MTFPPRYPHEGEGSNSLSPRPMGDDSSTALVILKEKRIALDAADLSEKIRVLATKLRADRDEKIRLEAELQVYRSMTDEEFAVILQPAQRFVMLRPLFIGPKSVCYMRS